MRQENFQEIEEEEGDTGKITGEEGLMRCVAKHKKKIRGVIKESSSDEDEEPAKKKKVSDYITSKI